MKSRCAWNNNRKHKNNVKVEMEIVQKKGETKNKFKTC